MTHAFAIATLATWGFGAVVIAPETYSFESAEGHAYGPFTLVEETMPYRPDLAAQPPTDHEIANNMAALYSAQHRWCWCRVRDPDGSGRVDMGDLVYTLSHWDEEACP